MFTGIIEELGEIIQKRSSSGGVRLLIKGKKVMEQLQEGDSIAVNGVCLTVNDLSGEKFAADVMPETFRKTNLEELQAGSLVNLERALAVGARLGGHFVSGHIDATGKILNEKTEGNALLKELEAPRDVLRYVVEKGSIAIDGISLTVFNVKDHSFSVSLIPHTARYATLGFKKPGQKVNLEVDMLVKYVEKLLHSFAQDVPIFSLDDKKQTSGAEKGELTLSFLREKGFI